MVVKLKILSGSATIASDGLKVSGQSAVRVGFDKVVTKEKYFFEITFAGGGYKNLQFDAVAVASGTRSYGTFGFEVDHTTKTITTYQNGSLYKTSTYTQTTVPQLYVYMNESDTTTFNFGASPFKYGTPNGFPVVNSSYLTLMKYDSKMFSYDFTRGSWYIVGNAPGTQEMFLKYGLESLMKIPSIDIKKLVDLKASLVSYSKENDTPSVYKFQTKLYDKTNKRYKGICSVDTPMEVIPKGCTNLVLSAEHNNCSFSFSLDNGVNWTSIDTDVVTDISKMTGNELVIKGVLPTTASTLSAISYAWA